MTQASVRCRTAGIDAGQGDPPPIRLRLESAGEAAVHLLVILLFFYAIRRVVSVPDAVAGGAAAAAILAAVHGILWRRLAENRRPGSSGIAPGLGAANRLTLWRGALISLTAGFLFIDFQGDSPSAILAWLPGSFYLTAAVLDGLDGAYARRTGTPTSLGKILDLNVDALGVLAASSVAVAAGRLPVYYLAAGMIYYVYQAGLWWRRRRGKPIHPPPSRQFARLVAGFQMGFLGIALLPVLAPEVLRIAAPVLLLPLLAGFWWDWRTVRGGAESRCFTGAAGLLRGLILAAAAGLLWWAWRDVDVHSVTAAIGLWDWPRWLAFVMVNLAVLGAMCWRWQLILRQMGHPVGFSPLVRYRMAANALSFITPGPQFGGEPLQVLGLTCRHRVPRETASASVAVDRLAELTGNLLFLSIGAVFILPSLMDNAAALMAAAAFMIGGALVSGGLLYGVAQGRAPLSRMAGWVLRPAEGKCRTERLLLFLRESERRASPLLTNGLAGRYAGMGMVQWLAFLAELWLIYAFLGFPMRPQALLTTAVAMRLTFLLPFPGGLGALEAGQALALASLGGDPVTAAAACGIMRLRDLVTISVGGLIAVRLGRSPLRPRRMPGAA